MALYEGIALIQEKQAVVLDLGTDYTKFGFTGEAAPRCIVRSEFWCATERRQKRVDEYKSPDELYDNLVHMLHQLYFRHVLVNPKERKVVVVESLLTPTLFRETLAKVLFLHYEVSGVIWADSPRMCALTLGAPIVLVVSIGAKEAEVAAVVHSCVVLKSLQTAPLGAHAIHSELAKLLEADNEASLELPDQLLEDIKVKCCFVGSRSRALQWESSPPPPAKGVQFRSGGRALLVSGRTRELAAEPLFQRDNEMASLPDIVLQCIMQSPVDARRELCANMLVTGGGAALPGLRARLRDELRHLLSQPPYSPRLGALRPKFHSAPAPDNCVGWLGGALCGASEALGAAAGASGPQGRLTPRDAFARQGRLRDWVCLLDNAPPQSHFRDHLDI